MNGWPTSCSPPKREDDEDRDAPYVDGPVKYVEYLPFDTSRYWLPNALDADHYGAIENLRQRADWAHLSARVPTLYLPLRDLAARTSTSKVLLVSASGNLLKHVHACQLPYCQWSESQ